MVRRFPDAWTLISLLEWRPRLIKSLCAAVGAATTTKALDPKNSGASSRKPWSAASDQRLALGPALSSAHVVGRVSMPSSLFISMPLSITSVCLRGQEACHIAGSKTVKASSADSGRCSNPCLRSKGRREWDRWLGAERVHRSPSLETWLRFPMATARLRVCGFGEPLLGTVGRGRVGCKVESSIQVLADPPPSPVTYSVYSTWKAVLQPRQTRGRHKG
ncbi:hypothetical protein VUR80DRAFT_8782 [Thermomyces stellatus]